MSSVSAPEDGRTPLYQYPEKHCLRIWAVALLALVLFQAGAVFGAQTYTGDTTFNTGAGATQRVPTLGVQSDNKIVIGGDFTTLNGSSINRIARLNSDGTLDTTFNPGTGANGFVWRLLLQTDGKALIAGEFTSVNGTTRNRVARLNSDGSLDAGFDPGTGITSGQAYGLAVQSDDKILVSGNFTSFNGTSRKNIVRLNSDGSLDTSFNPGTSSDIYIWKVVLQSDGKALIGGQFTSVAGTSRPGLARLNTDGSLDSTFSPAIPSGSTVLDVVLQSDSKVVAVGGFTGVNGFIRLNTDGTADGTFSTGSGSTAFVRAVALQSDGKVVIGGQFTSLNGTNPGNIARLNSDGSLDTSFDAGSGVNNAVFVVGAQSDGKVLLGGDFTTVAGASRARLARLQQIVNAAPVLGGLSSAVTFAENTVNASAQVIDSSVTLTDDGSNFSGGNLTVSYSSGGGAQDQLSVRNQGTGAGQIGFSSGTVTYQGTTIGTMPTSGAGSGINGQTLIVTLNSSATVAATKALIENLSYRNTSDTPTGSRTISVTVNDGAGGTSTAQTVAITVNAENDAPTLTSVSALSGATATVPFTISYATLAGAADEAEPDGDTLSFRIEAVSSGTLTKNGSAVTAGSTLLGSGESFVWTPASSASGTVNAFTIVASDGTTASSAAIQVQVQVTGIASFPISENFDGKTTGDLTSANWLILDNATVTGNKLRLTPAVNVQKGSGIYNKAFSSSLGVNVQFDYFIGNGTHADGLVFFLLDGTVATPTTGAPGGSLGYAYGDTGTLPGLSQAYLGVAFDVFGNFINNQFLHDGLGSGLFPNRISIRGPATITDSKKANQEYDYVVGSATAFTVEGTRKVNLTVKSNGTISMRVSTDGGSNWTTVYSDFNFGSSAAFSGYSTPGVFKLGFTASTGGQNNEHSIDNLLVTIPVELAVAFTSSPSGTQAIGATANYTVTMTNNGPNADSAAQFSYTVPAGITGVTWNYSIAGGGGSGSGNGSGNNISAALNLPSGATATFNVSGTISASAAGQTLTHTATATASSGFGDSNPTNNSGTASTTVAPNTAPTLTSVSALTGASEDASFVIDFATMAAAANEADSDGDTVSFRIVSVNSGTLTKGGTAVSAGSTLLSTGESLAWTPAANANGTLSAFSVKAWDGQLASTTAVAVQVSVQAVNDSPSFSKGANQSVLEDAGAQSVAGWATAISAGPSDESGQVLTFQVTNDNNGLFSTQPAVSTTGTLTYTPTANANGSATVTISVKDDGGTANGGSDTSGSQTFTITVNSVNDAPTFTKGANQSVLEDAGAQSVANWATAISAGPSDESGQALTYQVSNDNNSLFATQPTISATGTLSYTPAANANGNATVTISLKDEGGTANGGANTSGFQTFTITVTAANDSPSFTKGANQSVLEDAGAQTIAGWATAISAGPSDESGQMLTFQVSNDNNGLFSAQPAVSATGALTCTPAANANGSATVTVSLKDDGGTANGGSDTSASQTFTIAVTAVNDPPTFTKGANQSVLEDAGAQSVAGWATAISAGPSDESGQALTFQVSNDNNSLFATQPTISATGTLSYTPAADANGSATVTVSLKDEGGTANGGSDTSGSQTFTITVTSVNDASTFTKGANQSVLEDAGAQSVAGWATAISAGPADEGGQTLTFQVSNDNNSLFSTQPAVSATGTLIYTPAANANGSATVTVSLKDDGGTANGGSDTSAAQTFTIAVIPVNDAPTLAVISDQTILEDAAEQTIVLGGIATGASNESQTLSVTATSNNPGLIPNPTITYASPNDSALLKYQPLPDANGTATITVTVGDDGGTANGGVGSVTRTFTVTVTPVNDAPTLAAISNPAAILEDAGQQTIQLGGIGAGAANETQFLSVTATSNNSSLIPDPAVTYSSPDGTGTLRYTPVADANGTATITVTVSDDGGTANGGVFATTRTFVVAVTPVNDPPTLGPIENLLIREDSVNAYGVGLSGIAAGPSNENQALRVTLSSSNPELLAELSLGYTSPNSVGGVTVRPAPNANGSATVTIGVTDDGGLENGGLNSISRSFEVRVLSVNDAPTLTRVNILTGAREDEPFTAAYADLAAASDAADVDGDALAFRVDAVLSGTMTKDGAAVVAGQTVIRAGESLVWLPPPNANGKLDAFTVRAFDGALASADAKTVSIVVTSVNDPPTLSAIADQTVDEDNVALASFAVDDVESPASALQLRFRSSNTNLVRTEGILLSRAEGVCRVAIMPQANQSGTATITVTVMDEDDRSASRTFDLVVRPVNDAPGLTKVSPLAEATEDQPFAIPYASLLAASDAADADGDALSFRVESVVRGTLTKAGMPVAPGETMIQPGQSLSWLAPTNANGTLGAFTVTAHDGKLSSGEPVAVSVIVAAVNDPPVLSEIPDQTAEEDQAVSVGFNVVDAESLASELLVTVQSSNTNLVRNEALVLTRTESLWKLAVTPVLNQSGTATITATVVDGEGLSTNQSFRIAFNPVNDPPVLTRVGVLTNATFGLPFEISYQMLAGAADAADVEGDPIAFQLDELSSGALTSGGTNLIPGALLATNAVWRWIPNTNGIVQAMAIRAFDGKAASSNAVPVNLEVKPATFANAKLVASDGKPKELFGYAVATDGATILVGAPQAGDASGRNPGAAYLYGRAGTNWVEQTKLVAKDGANGDRFGSAAAISGKTLAVGAEQARVLGNDAAGAAYVFGQSGTNWIEQAKVHASDAGEFARFGSALAFSGETLVVGAPQAMADGQDSAGAAYVFVRRGANWVEEAKLTAEQPAPQDWFGLSVGISGDTIVVGALLADLPEKKDVGVAYVFARSGTNWVRKARLTAGDGQEGDRFGSAVSISADRLVVGALLADPSGTKDAGAAYFFTRDGNAWIQQTKLTALDGRPDNWFGSAVAISGDALVVGATQSPVFDKKFSGAAYKFVWDGKGWLQEPRLLARDHATADRYGSSIALAGGTAVIGTYLSDPSEKIDAGAAYVFSSGETATSEQSLPSGEVTEPSTEVALLASASHQVHISSRLADDCSCLISLDSSPASAVRIVISGPVGQAIQLQASGDFSRWTAVTNLVLTSFPGEYLDRSSSSSSLRFYRIVDAPAFTPATGSEGDR